MAGDQDDLQLSIEGAGAADDLEAVDAGHLVVDHEEIDRPRGDLRNGGLAVRRAVDLVADSPQHLHAEIQDRLFVIHHENAHTPMISGSGVRRAAACIRLNRRACTTTLR